MMIKEISLVGWDVYTWEKHSTVSLYNSKYAVKEMCSWKSMDAAGNKSEANCKPANSWAVGGNKQSIFSLKRHLKFYNKSA